MTYDSQLPVTVPKVASRLEESSTSATATPNLNGTKVLVFVQFVLL